MWVSTKAQYGLRALVEIAVNGHEPVSLKYISERHGISQQYLEQIVAVMRRAGIVRSVRGAHGGYHLARELEQVSALEVVELMEGSLAPVTCIDDEENCAYTGQCSTEGLWRRVDEAVRQVLARTSLGDLVAERRLLQLEPLPEAFGHLPG